MNDLNGNKLLEKYFDLLRESVQESLLSGYKELSIGDNNIFFHSEKGRIRENNEDRVAFVIIENRAFQGSDLAVGILADGMGGMREGAKASSISIAAFIAYIALGHSGTGIKELSRKAADYANLMLLKYW